MTYPSLFSSLPFTMIVRRLIICLFVMSICARLMATGFLYVTPNGVEIQRDGSKVQSLSFQKALEMAKPGSTILLLEGTYVGVFTINHKGTKGQPIVIKAASNRVLIDGKQKPTNKTGYCFKIENTSWIRVEGLRFKNCWAAAIWIQDSSQIHFSGLDIEGSRHGIFARGEQTHSILLEKSKWNQDPSGRLWKEIPWASAHHGAHSYFNGSLFSSREIKGDVTIRHNKIMNAYNGIRMVGNAAKFKSINTNVNIHDNLFFPLRIKREGRSTRHFP